MYLQATWYSAEEMDTLVEPTKTRLRSIYSKQVCRISGSIGWFAGHYSLLAWGSCKSCAWLLKSCCDGMTGKQDQPLRLDRQCH